jgi:hypothetical protein
VDSTSSPTRWLRPSACESLPGPVVMVSGIRDRARFVDVTDFDQSSDVDEADTLHGVA